MYSWKNNNYSYDKKKFYDIFCTFYRLQHEFKRLLEENLQVTPGRPLSETHVFFWGKECYSSLDEQERNQVYEQHMAELRATCRANFQELMWEKSHVFLCWSMAERLTTRDLQSITTTLQDDSRYVICMEKSHPWIWFRWCGSFPHLWFLSRGSVSRLLMAKLLSFFFFFWMPWL